MRKLAAVGLLSGLVLSLFSPTACTLTRKKADCASTAECRDAFGSGTVCAESGLCEQMEVNVACTAQLPADLLTRPEQYVDYVVLGSLLRAEGKEGARHDSAKLAVEAVNRYLQDSDTHPELANLQFGLVQCTHDGNVDTIADLAEYLVETVQVPAILGPASSSATTEAFERLNIAEDGKERRQVLFMSPSATSLALSSLEQDSPGLLWRTAPTDDGQGRLMGQYATDQSKPFVAFYEDTAYGKGLFKELEDAAGELCDNCGFSFPADTASIQGFTSLFARDESRDALAAVDTVFFMGAQEAHLREMMERLPTDLADKLVFFSDAAASSDTVMNAMGHIDQVVGTRVRAAQEGEPIRLFKTAYEGTHDEDPLLHSFTAHTYDAAWLLLLSSLKARMEGERVSPETIATGLRQLSDDTWQDLDEDACPNRLKEGLCPELTLDASYLGQILEALKRRGKVNVQGASGNLDYDLDSEELENSADAFEFWYLQEVVDEEIGIIGGMPPG